MASDAQLLQKWQTQRDSEAFAEIVRRYSGLVYGAARRILGDPAEAEDVAQECFLKLSRMDNGETANSLGGWLHTVAINRAIDRQRSQQRRATREQAFSATAGQTSHELREWREFESHIDQAITELPDELRKVIVAHFIEGNTHKTIAKRLGISRSAATRRIQKGVETLREILKTKGVEVASAVLAAGLTDYLVEAVPVTLERQLRKIALASSVDRSTPHTAPKTHSLTWKGATILAGLALVAALGLFAFGSLRPNTPTASNNTPSLQTVPAAPAPELPPSNSSPQILVAQDTSSPQTTSSTQNAEATTEVTEPELPSTFTFICMDLDGNRIPDARIFLSQTEIAASVALSPSSEDKNVQFFGPFISDENGEAVLPAKPKTDRYRSQSYASAFARVPGQYVGAWWASENNIARGKAVIKLVPTQTIEGTVSVPPDFVTASVKVHILTMYVHDGAGGGIGSSFSLHKRPIQLPQELATYATVQTDNEGRFRLSDIPIYGTLYLEARAPGLAHNQTMQFDLAQEFSPHFDMELEGVLTGTVYWSDTANAAAGIRVSARPTNVGRGRGTSSGSPRAVVTYPRETTTDGFGNYRIEDMMPNAYNVFIRNTDPYPRWVSSVVENVEVTSGQIAEGVNLVLEPGALQTGYVVFEDNGEPIVGARVRVLSPGMGGESIGSAWTDEDGAFQVILPTGPSMTYFPILPPEVRYPKDQGRQFIDVQSNAPDLPPLYIKLRRNRKLATPSGKAFFVGRVVDENGNGIERINVGHEMEFMQGEQHHKFTWKYVTYTDKDGAFRIEIYAIGRYRVRAGGGKYTIAEDEWIRPRKDQVYNIPDLVVKRSTGK